jgi:hypothetical protein
MDYSYNVLNDITSQVLHEETLHNEIVNNQVITQAFNGIARSGNDFRAIFETALSTEEKNELDAIVLAHTGSILPIYEGIVQRAIDFFHNAMIIFAAENITMGITQAGKTKDVADYLQDIMRYGQSGSLYEVITAINELEAIGHPTDLAPFVTTERMALFKGKIEVYLGL